MRYNGFEPCFDKDAKILILGSFPSVKSRENAFYYGNPQNRFWKTLAEFYGEELPQSVAEKKRFVLRNNLALWDVVQSCEIEGSLDSNIKNYEIADVKKVTSAANINKIILNGGTAAKLFNSYFPDLSDLCVCLPSTSPANTRFDKNVWFDALKK